MACSYVGNSNEEYSFAHRTEKHAPRKRDWEGVFG